MSRIPMEPLREPSRMVFHGAVGSAIPGCRRSFLHLLAREASPLEIAADDPGSGHPGSLSYAHGWSPANHGPADPCTPKGDNVSALRSRRRPSLPWGCRYTIKKDSRSAGYSPPKPVRHRFSGVTTKLPGGRANNPSRVWTSGINRLLCSMAPERISPQKYTCCPERRPCVR